MELKTKLTKLLKKELNENIKELKKVNKRNILKETPKEIFFTKTQNIKELTFILKDLEKKPSYQGIYNIYKYDVRSENEAQKKKTLEIIANLIIENKTLTEKFREEKKKEVYLLYKALDNLEAKLFQEREAIDTTQETTDTHKSYKALKEVSNNVVELRHKIYDVLEDGDGA